ASCSSLSRLSWYFLCWQSRVTTTETAHTAHSSKNESATIKSESAIHKNISPIIVFSSSTPTQTTERQPGTSRQTSTTAWHPNAPRNLPHSPLALALL